ncbi:hypothetical protein, partial [Oceanobacter antarcticus]
ARLAELGMLMSYSRPRVSNDNPYSESLFRTVKYCPAWPSKVNAQTTPSTDLNNGRFHILRQQFFDVFHGFA